MQNWYLKGLWGDEHGIHSVAQEKDPRTVKTMSSQQAMVINKRGISEKEDTLQLQELQVKPGTGELHGSSFLF